MRLILFIFAVIGLVALISPICSYDNITGKLEWQIAVGDQCSPNLSNSHPLKANE